MYRKKGAIKKFMVFKMTKPENDGYYDRESE